MKYGHLKTRTLALAVPADARVREVTVSAAGRRLAATRVQKGSRVEIALRDDVTIAEGQSLRVEIAW